MMITSYVIPTMLVGLLLAVLAIVFIDKTNVNTIRRIALVTVCAMLAGSIQLFVQRILLDDDAVLGYNFGQWVYSLAYDQATPYYSTPLILEINVFSAWLVVAMNIIMIVTIVSGYYIKTRHRYFYLYTLILYFFSLIVAMSTLAWLTFFFLMLMAILLFMMIGIWSKAEQYQFAIRFIFIQTLGLCFIGLSLLILQFVVMDQEGQGLILKQTMSYIETYLYLSISEVGYRNLALIFMLIGFAFLSPLVGFHSSYIALFSHSRYPVLLLVVGLYTPLVAFSFKQYLYSYFLDYVQSIQVFCITLAVLQISYMAVHLWKTEKTKEWIGYLSLTNIPIMYILIISDLLVTASFGLLSILSFMLTMSVLLFVMMALRERKDTDHLDELKGLFKQKPYLSSLTILTLLAVTGLPVFSHYFTVFHAFYVVYHIHVTVFIICLVSVFLVTINVFLHMSKLFIVTDEKVQVAKKPYVDLRLSELAAPILLISFVFMLGIYPSVFLERIEEYVDQTFRWLDSYEEVTIWSTDFYWSLIIGDTIASNLQFVIAVVIVVTLLLSIWLASKQRQNMLSFVYWTASHFASIGLAGIVLMNSVDDTIIWRQLIFYVVSIGLLFVGTHFLLSRHMHRSLYDEATHYEGLYYKKSFLYVAFIIFLLTIVGGPMSPIGIIRFEIMAQLMLERYVLLTVIMVISFAFMWRPIWYWIATICFPVTNNLLLNRKEQIEDWTWSKTEKGLVLISIIINMVLMFVYNFT